MLTDRRPPSSKLLFDLNDGESTVTSPEVVSTFVINRLVSWEPMRIRTYLT